jgi:hypothetical protein
MTQRTLNVVGLVLCVLGVGTLFMPWAGGSIIYFDPAQPPQPDGSRKAQGIVRADYPGHRFWHGITAGGLLLGMFLFQIATGTIHPPPWWRPAVMLGAGVGIIAAVLAGMNGSGLPQGDPTAGRVVSTDWGTGNFVALGLAAAVMLVAALELRGLMNDRKPSVNPAPGGAP